MGLPLLHCHVLEVATLEYVMHVRTQLTWYLAVINGRAFGGNLAP